MKCQNSWKKQFSNIPNPTKNCRSSTILCGITSFNIYFILSFQVFHDMANFVRSESIVSLNCCKDSEVIDIPRCYYTRWAGEDNVKEDLIILENLYPQVKSHTTITFLLNPNFSSNTTFENVGFKFNLLFQHSNGLAEEVH